MKKYIGAKKMYIILLAVFFVFVSLSETTYSLFIKSNSTDEFGYNTGLLDLEFIEGETIKLENVFPVIDSDGVKLKPYVLTLKNTGNLPYLYDLKMIGDDDNIDYKYIKVKVNDNLPHSLYSTNNVLIDNNIIYPGEEATFKINVWLDSNTPNSELGKVFNAKIVTSGSSTYKTLDNSGANRPVMANDMIPVYYNEENESWHVADGNNTNNEYTWYNYNNKMWANVVTLKNSDKYIYDLTRRHDIKIDNASYDNTNYVVNDKYLNINLGNVNYNGLSNIYRVKFNKLDGNNYIMSNDTYSYYYDSASRRFVFDNEGSKLVSNEIRIDANTWYIVGYTYTDGTLKFYANGNNAGVVSASIDMRAFNSYKLGTDLSAKKLSKVTFGDVLVYDKVLSDNEISSNYKGSIRIINDGLVAGYNDFIPMTLSEYYHNLNNGSKVNMDDVKAFYVWIPRFKYMLWNAAMEEGIDSYNAYGKGINISFENGLTSSGVVTCDSTGCFGDINKTMAISNADNGKYYVHPAFTKSTGEVHGFWVSKYELSANSMMKPGLSAWVNSSLTDYYREVSKLGKNYHIIKNTEWGAISYLAHSKYGLCDSKNCLRVNSNDKYIAGNNLADSTTGNMYGVFDMAGSAWEYTMSSFDDINISASDVPISNDDYDLYADSYILGDATRELAIEGGIWDNGNISSNLGSFIIRGGTGIYSYNRVNNMPYDYVSTRVIYK